MPDTVIWKWHIGYAGDNDPPRTELQMPTGARVVKVDLAHGQPELPLATDPRAARDMRHMLAAGRHAEMWAVVDLQHVGDDEPRTFTVVDTGQPWPDEPTTYLDTFRDGPLVWHLLEVLPPKPAPRPGPLDSYDQQDWNTARQRGQAVDRAGRLARLLHAHRHGVPIVVVSTGAWAKELATRVGLHPDEWQRLDEERHPLTADELVLITERGAEIPAALRGRIVHHLPVSS